MTKEELKQEARQKALEWNGEKINGKYNRLPIANWSCYEKGYLAGAESREKRIEELEESNKEWQRTCEAKSDTNSQLIEQLANKVEKSAELEKENAELKERNRGLDAMLTGESLVSNELEEQLTKAKEIIKNLLSAYTSYADSFDDRDNEIVSEAEQFLNSEVVK